MSDASRDDSPSHSEVVIIPARTAKLCHLERGRSVKITNTYGQQVLDLFAVEVADDEKNPPYNILSYLSMGHTRAALGRLVPRVGDYLYDNCRRPMLKLLEDTSGGVHDTMFPACDPERYRMLGVLGPHASCMENFYGMLSDHYIAVERHLCPAPLNLWMNVPIGQNGSIRPYSPLSKPGDYVVFEAVRDVAVVMSACPMDVLPGNGDGPKDCHFETVAA